MPVTRHRANRGALGVRQVRHSLRRVQAPENPGGVRTSRRGLEGLDDSGDTLWSPEERPYRAGFLSNNWLTFAMAESWHKASQAKAAARSDKATRPPARAGLSAGSEAPPPLPRLRLVG
jgi:hypothetical protein